MQVFCLILSLEIRSLCTTLRTLQITLISVTYSYWYIVHCSITLDTPMNRKFMSKADFSSWTPLETVAECVLF